MSDKCLDDLLWVGINKSVGYLPLSTLVGLCNVPVSRMMNMASSNGLKSLLFSEEECDIGSGALYVYDEAMLSSLLREYQTPLSYAGVPTDNCEAYIRYISNNIVFEELYPEAYIAIGKTFNDPRFTCVTLSD
jgi:hypothetical protein